MVNFWSKIVTGKQSKYSCRLYSLIYILHNSDKNMYKSKWICKIKDIIDTCGFSHVWTNQNQHNSLWLKRVLSRRTKDIDMQQWITEVNENSSCIFYRYFKDNVSFEFYLKELDFSNRLVLTKFRCRNFKLPINISRFSIENNDKICKLCNLNVIGDEYHYLFNCVYFNIPWTYISPWIYQETQWEPSTEHILNWEGSWCCPRVAVEHHRCSSPPPCNKSQKSWFQRHDTNAAEIIWLSFFVNTECWGGNRYVKGDLLIFG